MAKQKYVAQIQPKIAKEDEVALTRQFKGISSGFKVSMNTALKVGTAVAGAGIVMAWWNHQKKAIDSVNNSFNDYLANADRLSTIANDLQTNAGSFALTDLGLSTFGLNQEDRDKLYSSIKGAMSEGKITQSGGNLLGSLVDIQNEYKQALKVGDIGRQEFLKSLTGLRGQKATEFLGGDLQSATKVVGGKFNAKDIEMAVNKGGELEQQQAESLAIQQLKGMIQVSKVANEGIIKSQEQYNEALKQATLEQYNNYDNMIKFEIAKQKTINNLWSLIDNLVNPIIARVGNGSNNAVSILTAILGAVLGGLFNSFKTKIVSYINDIINSLGLSKLFGLKTTKLVESEKNTGIQNFNNANEILRGR